MRIVLAALVWIVLVGGLWTYVQHRDASYSTLVNRSAPELQKTETTYQLTVTPTFSLEKDPFALNLDERSGAQSLTIAINGQRLSLPDTLEQGQPYRIDQVEQVVYGYNELFLQASPPLDAANRDHAVRITLADDNQLILDRTLWSHKGSLVTGSIMFTIAHEESSHDH